MNTHPSIPDELFYPIDCLDRRRRMYAGPKQLSAIQKLTGKSLFRGENFIEAMEPEQLPELMQILCSTDDPTVTAEQLEPFCCIGWRLNLIWRTLGDFISGEPSPLSPGGPSAVSTSA